MREVPPEMLMCRMHWFKVPRDIRNEVWRTYREGQCNWSPMPSREWHEAATKAINYVAKLEGMPLRPEHL